MELPRDKDYVVNLKVGDSGEVRLRSGDLTQYPADALVNAANSELSPGGGVCGAIHRAGGSTIAEECRRLRAERGPVPPGGAVATTAGRLPAKYVIHAVGPVWYGGDRGEAELLSSCYRESIRVADDLKLHSIAFPAISTGIFGYPVDKAAVVTIPSMIDGLLPAKNLVLVSLVLFDKASLDTFAQVAARLKPKSGQTYQLSIGTKE
jgi:O-acetyl-ADP-ribose deacetylase (regulator of RNase III)